MIYNQKISRNNTIDKLNPLYNYSNLNTLVLQNRQINNLQGITRMLLDVNQYYIEQPDKVQLILNLAKGDILYHNDIKVDCHKVVNYWDQGIYYGTKVPSNWVQRSQYNDWDTQGGDFSIQSTSCIINYKNLSNLVFDITNFDSFFGYLIKFEDESFDKELGTIEYYSIYSNYVFNPFVRLYKNDYQFQDLSQNHHYIDNPFFIFLKNFKSIYKVNQKIRHILNIVPKRINQTWGRKTYQQYQYIVSSQSASIYYRILDITQFRRYQMIPFDETYTKISYSQQHGMYFDLDMSQFTPNRNYEIQFLLDKGFQKIRYDRNYRFRVRL